MDGFVFLAAVAATLIVVIVISVGKRIDRTADQPEHPMMFPLILLWLAAVYIFIERLLVMKKASKTPDDFKDKIRSRVLAGDIEGAKILCKETRLLRIYPDLPLPNPLLGFYIYKNIKD